MGRPRIEKTKFVALYLTNTKEYELIDDASFGRVIKAVMKMKNSEEETELSELERFVYNKLMHQVNEDEKRYLEKKEEDRKRKSSFRAHEITSDKETIIQEEKVAEIEGNEARMAFSGLCAPVQNNITGNNSENMDDVYLSTCVTEKHITVYENEATGEREDVYNQIGIEYVGNIMRTDFERVLMKYKDANEAKEDKTVQKWLSNPLESGITLIHINRFYKHLNFLNHEK